MKDKPDRARATTLEELEAVLDNFFDEDAFERGLLFKQRPSDIILSPYANCGTTWHEQMRPRFGLKNHEDLQHALHEGSENAD